MIATKYRSLDLTDLALEFRQRETEQEPFEGTIDMKFAVRFQSNQLINTSNESTKLFPEFRSLFLFSFLQTKEKMCAYSVQRMRYLTRFQYLG